MSNAENQSTESRKPLLPENWDSVWTSAFFFVFLGLLLLTFYWTLAAFLVALASLSSGFVIGFLFGIPRVPQPPGSDTSSQSGTTPAPQKRVADNSGRVNNNLIEISDWLCKIIVGLGLVEIRSIPERFQTLAEYLAEDLGATPNPTMAGAIVVYFGTVGFLFGYIATRTILTMLFDHVDRPTLEGIENRMVETERETRHEVAWTQGRLAQMEGAREAEIDEAIRNLTIAHEEVPDKRKYAMTLSYLVANKRHNGSPPSPNKAINVLNTTRAAWVEKGEYDKKDWADLHYNLACFYQLERQAATDTARKDELANAVYANLRIAFGNSDNVEEAKKDPDFQQILTEQRFIDLVNEFSPTRN